MYQLRLAIRSQHKLSVQYCDLNGKTTVRTLWPLALGYFEQTMVLMTWCELRQGFRHFRTDRIVSLTSRHERYSGSRERLLLEWKKQQFDA